PRHAAGLEAVEGVDRDAQQRLAAEQLAGGRGDVRTDDRGCDRRPGGDAGDEVGHHQGRQVVEADVAQRRPEQGDGGAHRTGAQLGQGAVQREPQCGAPAVDGGVGVGCRPGYRWVGDGGGDVGSPPDFFGRPWARSPVIGSTEFAWYERGVYERVLVCFGDSNTHGSPPWSGEPAPRYGPDVRGPGVLAAALGPSWRLHEEGLPGRTTVHPDPVEGGHLSGLA